MESLDLGHLWNRLFDDITIRQFLRYWVFENDQVVKEGAVEGHTWNTTGKTYLAFNFTTATNYPINRFYYTVGGVPTFQATTPAVGGSTNIIVVTSTEITTLGAYTAVGAGNSTQGQYDSITVALTLTTGQSVIFQITYTFTPYPGVGTPCAARMGNFGTAYNDYVRSIGTWDGSEYRGGRKDSVNSNNANTLICDNLTNFQYTGSWTITSIHFLFPAGVFFHTQTVSIPVANGEELDIQGRFTFG